VQLVRRHGGASPGRGRDGAVRRPERVESEHALLLREVHHRVKNNLQVMMSLINLEGSRAASPEVRRIVGMLQGRLRAVALVHDQLHRSTELRTVDLRAYVSAVARGIGEAHGLEERGIDLGVRVSTGDIGMNDALKVGLIVNELVSNAIAHGFPGRSGGRIAVAVSVGARSRAIRLRVSNDGVPLPPHFHPPSDRLGLAIVGNVVRNSGGRIRWSQRRVTSFTVELRLS
jgi:two-component sensor histidine kinase